MPATTPDNRTTITGDGHTPGPWRVDPANCQDVQAEGVEVCVALKSSDAGSTFKIVGPCPTATEARANARLIAAAPDLLEALLAAEDKAQRGILAMTDAEIERVSALRRAAIAKATSPSDAARSGGV